jgi:hypothetical protein
MYSRMMTTPEINRNNTTLSSGQKLELKAVMKAYVECSIKTLYCTCDKKTLIPNIIGGCVVDELTGNLPNDIDILICPSTSDDSFNSKDPKEYYSVKRYMDTICSKFNERNTNITLSSSHDKNLASDYLCIISSLQKLSTIYRFYFKYTYGGSILHESQTMYFNVDVILFPHSTDVFFKHGIFNVSKISKTINGVIKVYDDISKTYDTLYNETVKYKYKKLLSQKKIYFTYNWLLNYPNISNAIYYKFKHNGDGYNCNCFQQLIDCKKRLILRIIGQNFKGYDVFNSTIRGYHYDELSSEQKQKLKVVIDDPSFEYTPIPSIKHNDVICIIPINCYLGIQDFIELLNIRFDNPEKFFTHIALSNDNLIPIFREEWSPELQITFPPIFREILEFLQTQSRWRFLPDTLFEHVISFIDRTYFDDV